MSKKVTENTPVEESQVEVTSKEEAAKEVNEIINDMQQQVEECNNIIDDIAETLDNEERNNAVTFQIETVEKPVSKFKKFLKIASKVVGGAALLSAGTVGVIAITNKIKSMSEESSVDSTAETTSEILRSLM